MEVRIVNREFKLEERRKEYREKGFHIWKGFFSRPEVSAVHEEAKRAFALQIERVGVAKPAARADDERFEREMRGLFERDLDSFIGAGKLCQHSVAMHRLSLGEKLVGAVKEMGISFPMICTRPVMYFNSRHLAKSEVFYKTPPHQDWRSMQGSLNAMVVWIPLVDVNRSLGALEVIPGSHLEGLLSATPGEWGLFNLNERFQDSDYISAEVEAGDAVFFSSFLVHRSGDNVTDRVRWSMHFRYNDAEERTFLARKFPNPYIYKPQDALITPDFPATGQVRDYFLK
jgi:hypothetical protein